MKLTTALFMSIVIGLSLWASGNNFSSTSEAEYQKLKENSSSPPSPEVNVHTHEFTRPALANDPIDNLNPIDPDETFKGKGGFVYRSIDELEVDPALMKQLRGELDNFRSYGSIGKGKVTIEFERADMLHDALRKKGLNNLLNGLAFNPIHMTNILGTNFSLTGADDQGKFVTQRGWSGFFQSLSEQGTGRQVELSELQVETKLGDQTEIIIEFLNDHVEEVGASVQAMKDDSGNDIYSVQWSDGEREFTLNTKLFTRNEAIDLAEQVLTRYRQLPHQGWKTPYALDPNNPLHRIAIQRDSQRVR